MRKDGGGVVEVGSDMAVNKVDFGIDVNIEIHLCIDMEWVGGYDDSKRCDRLA